MDIEKEPMEITEQIYQAYGSSTGVLFGISPGMRSSVLAIVKAVLEHPRVSIKEKVRK